MSDTPSPPEPAAASEQHLMNSIAVAECQERWVAIQATFERDPTAAVAQAHTLATEIIEAYRSWAAHIAQGWCAGSHAPPGEQELEAALDGYHDLLRELIGL